MKNAFHLPSFYKTKPALVNSILLDSNNLAEALNQAVSKSLQVGFCLNKNHENNCIISNASGLEINLSGQMLQDVGLFDTSLQTPIAVISDYILRSGQLGLKIDHNIKIDKVTDKNDLMYLRLKVWRKSARLEVHFEEITGLQIIGSINRPCETSMIFNVQKMNLESFRQSCLTVKDLPVELVIICLESQIEAVKKIPNQSQRIILASPKEFNGLSAHNIALTACNGKLLILNNLSDPPDKASQYVVKLADRYATKGMVFGLDIDRTINKVGFYTNTDADIISRILLLADVD